MIGFILIGLVLLTGPIPRVRDLPTEPPAETGKRRRGTTPTPWL